MSGTDLPPYPPARSSDYTSYGTEVTQRYDSSSGSGLASGAGVGVGTPFSSNSYGVGTSSYPPAASSSNGGTPPGGAGGGVGGSLHFENEQLRQTVEDFKQLNQRLTDDYEKMKNERDELLRRVRDAEQDATAATVKATESGEKLLECEHAKQILQEQVWKLELEKRNLEGELEVAKMRRDEFLAREQQRQMELERLLLERERESQQREREQEEHTAERLQWEQELEELTQQLKDADAARWEEIALIRQEMEEMSARHEQERMEWEDERGRLQSEMLAIEERMQQAVLQAEELERELAERGEHDRQMWEAEMERLRQEFIDKMADLETEVESLRSMNQTLREEKDHLLTQIRDQHHSILTSLDMDRSELEQRHREELDGRLGPLMRELEEQRRKVRSLQRNMAFFLNKLNASRAMEKGYRTLQRNAEAKAALRRKQRRRENQLLGVASLHHRVVFPIAKRYFQKLMDYAKAHKEAKRAKVEQLLKKNNRKLGAEYWRKFELWVRTAREIKRHNRNLARHLEEVNKNRALAGRYFRALMRRALTRLDAKRLTQFAKRHVEDECMRLRRDFDYEKQLLLSTMPTHVPVPVAVPYLPPCRAASPPPSPLSATAFPPPPLPGFPGGSPPPSPPPQMPPPMGLEGPMGMGGAGGPPPSGWEMAASRSAFSSDPASQAPPSGMGSPMPGAAGAHGIPYGRPASPPHPQPSSTAPRHSFASPPIPAMPSEWGVQSQQQPHTHDARPPAASRPPQHFDQSYLGSTSYSQNWDSQGGSGSVTRGTAASHTTPLRQHQQPATALNTPTSTQGTPYLPPHRPPQPPTTLPHHSNHSTPSTLRNNPSPSRGGGRGRHDPPMTAPALAEIAYPRRGPDGDPAPSYPRDYSGGVAPLPGPSDDLPAERATEHQSYSHTHSVVRATPTNSRAPATSATPNGNGKGSATPMMLPPPCIPGTTGEREEHLAGPNLFPSNTGGFE